MTEHRKKYLKNWNEDNKEARNKYQSDWNKEHRIEENIHRREKYVEDKTVLDVCSYVGAWSVRAAMAGAKQVTSIDSSASALDLLEKNAEQNQVADKIEMLQGDAFDALKQLKHEERRFDVIILDPPAFMKRKSWRV